MTDVQPSVTDQNKALLPKLEESKYEVSPTIWEELTSEINRLTDLINGDNELVPDDVAKVTTLAKQVRNYGVTYRSQITKQATDYKKLLDAELDKLGYGVIEDYIAARNKEKKDKVNERLNNKLAKFNEIVKEALDNSTFVKTSSIANFVVNSLSSRFPKLNSGAESKEIANWEPVSSVVTMSINAVDAKMEQMPVILQLPATSQTMRAITQYLETGDVHLLENLNEKLEADTPILRQLVIKERVKTEESTVNEIESVLASDIDNKTKLERIQILMDVRRTIA